MTNTTRNGGSLRTAQSLYLAYLADCYGGPSPTYTIPYHMGLGGWDHHIWVPTGTTVYGTYCIPPICGVYGDSMYYGMWYLPVITCMGAPRGRARIPHIWPLVPTLITPYTTIYGTYRS